MAEGGAIDTIRKASSVITEGHLEAVKTLTKDNAFERPEAEEKSLREVTGDKKTSDTMKKLVDSALEEGASELEVLSAIHQGAEDGKVRSNVASFEKTLKGIFDLLKF